MKRKDGSAAQMTKSGARTKGRRFNFIDLLIILAVILLAAIIVNIFMPMSIFRGFMSSDERDIQYTVEFIGVDESFVEKIKENDSVIDSVSKYGLGNVMTVDYNTQYSVLEYNEAEQSGWLSPYPDKYNVLVTVSVSAEYHEGEGYSIGDRRIAVGELLYLRFPDFTGEGYCIGISEAE